MLDGDPQDMGPVEEGAAPRGVPPQEATSLGRGRGRPRQQGRGRGQPAGMCQSPPSPHISSSSSSAPLFCDTPNKTPNSSKQELIAPLTPSNHGLTGGFADPCLDHIVASLAGRTAQVVAGQIPHQGGEAKAPVIRNARQASTGLLTTNTHSTLGRPPPAAQATHSQVEVTAATHSAGGLAHPPEVLQALSSPPPPKGSTALVESACRLAPVPEAPQHHLPG